MNKKPKRPPFIGVLIGGVIGIPIGEAIVIMGKTPITAFRDYTTLYLTYLKSEWVSMEIIFVLLMSLYYLTMWYFDKLHK
jgi:ABC-type lipoprotein release transport system permease subunit